MTPCGCHSETFLSLLRDAAHWQFEIFLMVLIDGVIIGLIWSFLWKRFLKKHWDHHLTRDKQEGR
jgi:hypothetical protein